jgi:hypothetical protein
MTLAYLAFGSLAIGLGCLVSEAMRRQSSRVRWGLALILLGLLLATASVIR